MEETHEPIIEKEKPIEKSEEKVVEKQTLPVPFANLYDDSIDQKISEKLSKKKDIFIDDAIVSCQPVKKNRELVKF